VVVDGYISTFDVSSFAEALAERRQSALRCSADLALTNATVGRGCCALAANANAAVTQIPAMNSRRRISMLAGRARAGRDG
jgi:hypothetical protein